MIGVGRGVASVTTVDRARRMFRALVEQAGGGRLRWTQTLAQLPAAAVAVPSNPVNH
jgi:hypothetical protein